MQGMAYWIEKRAMTNPNRIAVMTETEQLTYKELDEKIRGMAAILKNKWRVKKGDRIAILSQNRLEYVVLLFSIAKLQCVAVPLNIRLNVNELLFQIKDSGATILVREDTFAEMAQSIQQETGIELVPIDLLNQITISEDLPWEDSINENAPYIICYTSGTTGKPKGAVLTQNNMYWNAINNVLAIDLTSMDRSIVLLPLFHIGGIGLFALPTLFVGGTIIIPGKFDPDKAIEMIEKYQVTVVMGVPSIHQAIYHCQAFHKANFRSVRWFYSGGAPCPHELIHAFKDKGYILGQGFGMTETSPSVFLLSREDALRKIGSVGKPVQFCEFKLVDGEGHEVKSGEVGHLIVRGPNVMTKYWNRPEATNEAIQNGWFHTGDLAKVDEEGFVYIIGRKKEMIISGGENIYPLEVEQVINQLPDVLEVGVLGVPDIKWGEVPIAFIAKKEGATMTAEEVQEYCRQYLAKYKVPKEIYFIDELPKNATGKIQKSQLVLVREQVKQ
ncbi:o-succinylbenzoate--CoA ligase [Neobacillus sp. YIM B02564]|jgi:fatty-acyl-CoA synthase|uniref:O-succinylbenzoate--CoA ligase n=1 Tax=Neobacillus paridis TaxID=2803862 RepID=A0ABS1TKH1_9BACI|nr:o-succinylbenzoate--CoA ligase [Neobacillus paridis]MBL4951815.1 o-succinylbenzoate--CoA ligase [Neobacillus paridis]